MPIQKNDVSLLSLFYTQNSDFIEKDFQSVRKFYGKLVLKVDEGISWNYIQEIKLVKNEYLDDPTEFWEAPENA